MCLFWVGQIGLVLEITGAGYMVLAAYKAHMKLRDKSHTKNAADLMQSTKEEVSSQYKAELVGFGLLFVGLVMQFIGNFSKE